MINLHQINVLNFFFIGIHVLNFLKSDLVILDNKLKIDEKEVLKKNKKKSNGRQN